MWIIQRQKSLWSSFSHNVIADVYTENEEELNNALEESWDTLVKLHWAEKSVEIMKSLYKISKIRVLPDPVSFISQISQYDQEMKQYIGGLKRLSTKVGRNLIRESSKQLSLGRKGNLFAGSKVPILKPMQGKTKKLNDFEFIGNINTREIHMRECSWVAQISKQNIVGFRSLTNAHKEGYDNCAYCIGESKR